MAEVDDQGSQDSARVPVIVGIGASAGGVLALRDLFDSLPADTGAAFIVIVHLDPEGHSHLPELLQRRTDMQVIQVSEPVPIEGNKVYVISPNRQMLVTDHHLSSEPFVEPRGHRSPIDAFFRSLAERLGDGFAVILSGAGSDGTVGARAVKETGGIILVQDPAEAEHASMPRSVIACGVADTILPIRQLAPRLVDFIQQKRILAAVPSGQAYDDDLVRRILTHLRVRTGHDFTKYKRSTVLRRLNRRMQITQADELARYYEVLRDNPNEAQALLGDLLISVTTFFRDRHVFDALKAEVIPSLFHGRDPSEQIRVWVPGCATGEEVYSMAILLLEERAKHDVRPQIQLFGSDLDGHALAIAREGRYPTAIEADVGEERLRRFFTREGDGYRIRQELRDVVLFANHNLLKDPPFSRMELISCRNLLIYLDRELQDQVVNTFYYVLNAGGYLVFGISESAEHPAGLFRPIDRSARIYQTTLRPGDKPHLVPRLLTSGRAGHDFNAPAGRQITPGIALNEAALHRRALEKIAPPSVLVDDSHRILHMSETAGRYIQPSGGPLSGDLVELVRPELRFELRAALHRAFENRLPTFSLPIPVRFNGSAHRVHFRVVPNIEDGMTLPLHAVVMFMEGEAVEDAAAADGQPFGDETVRRLTQELELTQTRLRTMREESEAANEELRAANEELESTNEEYRSTSEELETSKEELQSINEELQTMNGELKVKLDVISRTHSDLQNLMAATDVATLFLDSTLRIKRFTSRVVDLFSIMPVDEGRPITDFTRRLDYPDLVQDVRKVLADLTPLHREVRSDDNRCFEVRIRPYRTIDDKIDGIVMTFIDESERKTLSERQHLLLGELTHRVKNVLTVVQAIAHQTYRSSTSTGDFIERFDGRLQALGSAHGLLVQSDWRGADFAALARNQLTPYVSDSPDRLLLNGEPVLLPADLATPFGLVLHELAANASKYGALSRSGGRIELSWNLRNNGRLLTVVWQEKNGPPVTPPTREGFGSTLIDRTIPDAKVTRNFAKDGFTCKIEVPLTPET